MAILVKNARNTGNRSCDCGSWLEHWENYSGYGANGCDAINVGTHSGVLSGAHVRKAQGKDTSLYIVPLCLGHNQNLSGNFSVEGPLVSENKCGSLVVAR